MDLAALRERVKSDQGFDVSDAKVDELLNERYVQLVVDARWGSTVVSLGATTGAAGYVMPSNVLVLDAVFIDGGRYVRTSEDEWDSLTSGGDSLALATGDAGVFSAVDGYSFTLFPTPDTPGLAITGRGIVAPDPLVNDSDSPVLPADCHSYIAWGAIADLLRLDDERFDIADVYEQRFGGGVLKLRRRRNSRVAGGPQRMTIVGRG